jgi:hypothetical protein
MNKTEAEIKAERQKREVTWHASLISAAIIGGYGLPTDMELEVILYKSLEYAKKAQQKFNDETIYK